MTIEDNEEGLLRSVALENARSIRLARERAERELIQAQDELRRSREELTDFIENAAVAMQWIDPEGIILWANQAQWEMLGHTKEETIGHNISEFHVDQAAAQSIIQRLANRETLRDHEARLRGKDGSIREVLISTNVFSRSGKFVHTRCFTRDITEQKRAQEVRARLAAIVQSSDDAIVSKDLNGIIATWNIGAERLFGYTADEVIGKPISLLIPAERLDEEPSILERIRRGERIEHYETIRRRKDGTLLDVALTVSPIIDERGRVVGASKIGRDISERKRAEAELKTLMIRDQELRAEAETANRVKDEFLAMVSHELRTPLNAIVGWTQLLKSGRLDRSKTERAIQTIDRNAKAQSMIINELLDVARIISGKVRLDPKPVELAEVINAAIDVVRPAADAKAIKLVASLDEAAGPVSGESVRLQQVIWNLLSNAIKFTPKQGRVEIKLKRDGTHVVIEVSDTGCGIPANFLPRIFDRFQQADTSAKRLHGGLGLGLSIARTLVEMHGGTILAESEGKGRGAKFTVALPVMAVSGVNHPESHEAVEDLPNVLSDQEAADRELPDSDWDANMLDGIKVLTVDDQTDTRDLIALVLSRSGAAVTACSSAAAAFQALQECKPDVLVSDIGMPGEDGYYLMKRIRALKAEDGGRIPAIALTGFAGEADALKAHSAGYQVHLTKPIELRKLVATIARLCGDGERF
ncbi:MAG TPA: PAS domain S-box protein [Pyrinomonadaceae bacterium]|nr:PAS domain S-box protein [Pyrinomonadaceae bacterium]